MQSLVINLKSIIKKLVQSLLWANFFSRKSYAQEGEDLIVDRLLGKKIGFYVDVGAHHPYRYSNTYLFYKKGWRGIAIDPLPGLKTIFRLRRPRDVFLDVGISQKPSSLDYFCFNESALNTFDKSLATSRDGYKAYKVINKIDIRTDTLASILTSVNCPKAIDLLTVDVEGMDLEVLQSNDWSRFVPEVVIAECLASDLVQLPEDPVNVYLSSLGYRMIAKTGHSVIFQKGLL
jgi:FkbM family methyltransferase